MSVRQKADLLDLHRSGLYYPRQMMSLDQVTLMNEIREIYLSRPFFGYRRMTAMLRGQGYKINRKCVARLMQLLGLKGLCPKKNLSRRRKEEAVFPYLLKQCPPQSPNDAWCVDITYIKLIQGFAYLTAFIDVVSRKIMGWCLSPFLDAQSCLEAFHRAVMVAVPLVMNSDQGAQFTSSLWIEAMTQFGIKISMDGKGRCLDNITIERFWRSVKYEEVYLKCYESLVEARQAIAAYIEFYNAVRPHQALKYKTPNQVYEEMKGFNL